MSPPGGEVHHCVGAPTERPIRASRPPRGSTRWSAELPMLALILTRNLRPITIVLELGMVDVGGDDRSSARHLRSHQLGLAALAHGDVLHLLGDEALAGVEQLGRRFVAASLGGPFVAHRLGLLGRIRSGGEGAVCRGPGVAGPRTVRFRRPSAGMIRFRFEGSFLSPVRLYGRRAPLAKLAVRPGRSYGFQRGWRKARRHRGFRRREWLE